MKRTVLHILVCLCAFAWSSELFGQCDAVGGFVYSSDSTRCMGEKTVLILTGHRGEIFWQSSPAGADTWTILSEKDSILVEYPLEDTDYRAILDVEDPCLDDYSTIVTIDVLDANFAGALGFSQDICGLNFNLSAEGLYAGEWSVKSGPGTAVYDPDVNTADVNVDVTDYGAYVFAYTNGAGGCAAVNIETFEQNTAVAEDGIKYCSNVIREPFQLSASLSNDRATGTWSRIGTSYLIDSPNDTNTFVTPSSPVEGNYFIRWRENYGACSDDTVVSFSTYINPSISATSFGEVCDTIGEVIATEVLRSTDQYWEQLSGVGTINFSDSVNDTTNVSIKEYGVYSLQWKVENGYCADSAEISITFSEQPTADAGITNDACGLEALLNAEEQFGGQWRSYQSPVSGVATFYDANDDSTQVSINSIYGEYSFIWEETNSICTDSDTISFTFYEQPEADAGTVSDICGEDAILNANKNFSNGQWFNYQQPVSGTANINDALNDSTGVSINSVYGEYSFIWLETNAICADRDTLSFSFYEIPIADAGDFEDVCGDEALLNANKQFGGGVWQSFQAPASGVASIDDANNDSTQVGINAVYGEYSFIWQETNVICTDRDTISFSFYEIPIADAGDISDVCGDEAILNANKQFAVGQWQTYQTPASGIANIDNVNNDSTQVGINAVYGEYSFIWQETNAICTDYDTLSFVFFEQPIADAGSVTDVCGVNAVLNANKKFADGFWLSYQVPASAEVIFDDATSDSTGISINAVYDEYSFIWQETNAICTDRDTVSIAFFEQPVADAGVNDTLCGLATTLNASLSVGLGTWVAITSPTEVFFSNINLPTASVNTSSFGVYDFRWTAVNEICTDSDTVQISYIEPPTANAGNGGDTCNLEFRLNAIKSIGSSSGEWVLNTGLGFDSFSSQDSTVSLAKVTQPGSFTFNWIENNNGCTDTASVVVNYFDKPIANPGMGDDFCGLTGQLSAIDEGVSGIWSSMPATLIENNTSFVTNIEVSDTGLYELTWEVSNGVCSADSSIKLHFAYRPEVSIEAFNEVCGGTTSLNGRVSLGSPYWSVVSGGFNSPFENDRALSTLVNVGDEFGNYTFQLKAQNGNCADSTTSEVVFYKIPEVNAGNDAAVCGLEYSFLASVDDSQGSWYLIPNNNEVQFIPDETFIDASVEVPESGSYRFVRQNINGICVDADTVQIEFIPTPVAQIDSLLPLYNKFETPVVAQALSDNETGVWSVLEGTGEFSSVNMSNTIITNLSMGENIVVWSVDNGTCSDKDTSLIMVFDVLIPEVITPNNDGSNDYFQILGIEELSNVELTIMNRWGVEVFYSDDYSEGNYWDGTNKSGVELTNDTYFYVLNVNGSSPIKGFVMIKR